MRIVPILRPLVAALSLGAVLVAAPACKKASVDANATAEATVESLDSAPEAVIEENDNGSVTWVVTPEGEVKALLKTPDGKPITKNVKGELTWKTPNGDTKIPVKVDEKTGLLVAVGPKLEDDINPLVYTLDVEGKPWEARSSFPRAARSSSTPTPSSRRTPASRRGSLARTAASSSSSAKTGSRSSPRSPRGRCVSTSSTRSSRSSPRRPIAR